DLREGHAVWGRAARRHQLREGAPGVPPRVHGGPVVRRGTVRELSDARLPLDRADRGGLPWRGPRVRVLPVGRRAGCVARAGVAVGERRAAFAVAIGVTVIDDRPLPDARSRITRAGAKRLAQVRRLALRLTLLLGLSCL